MHQVSSGYLNINSRKQAMLGKGCRNRGALIFLFCVVHNGDEEEEKRFLRINDSAHYNKVITMIKNDLF